MVEFDPVGTLRLRTGGYCRIAQGDTFDWDFSAGTKNTTNQFRAIAGVWLVYGWVREGPPCAM